MERINIIIIVAAIALICWILLYQHFRPLHDRVLCFFGFHQPGEYCGEIEISYMDHDTGAVEYSNRLRCPVCRKRVGLDNSQ